MSCWWGCGQENGFYTKLSFYWSAIDRHGTPAVFRIMPPRPLSWLLLSWKRVSNLGSGFPQPWRRRRRYVVWESQQEDWLRVTLWEDDRCWSWKWEGLGLGVKVPLLSVSVLSKVRSLRACVAYAIYPGCAIVLTCLYLSQMPIVWRER